MTNEAYARLIGLKSNLPKSYRLNIGYVTEFHSILDIFESELERKLDGFRVPKSEIRRDVVSASYYMDQPVSVGYSESYCERGVLMSKIDAVLAIIQPLMKGRKMKRCPKCNSTYTDDSLNYCLQDGAALISEGASPSFHEAETLILHEPAQPKENKLRTMLKIEIEDNLTKLRAFCDAVDKRVSFPSESNIAFVQRGDALRGESLPTLDRQYWDNTPTPSLAEALDESEIRAVHEFYKQLNELVNLKSKQNLYSKPSAWRKDFEPVLNGLLEKGNPLK